ncbi:MAG: hypothetical protein JSS66_04505 [Armatimonadetes bacterium]|nr:hypothetical protein [Armatimonadota bacterium]
MKAQVLALTGILVGFGVFNNVGSLTNGSRPPESWLEEKVPVRVGDAELSNPEGNSRICYKMGDAAYKELDPIGITGQRFRAPGGKLWDVAVVAGNNMESFHDQRWCFKAQGWDLMEETQSSLKTKTYGEIPVSVVKIQRSGYTPTFAVFTFRGPSKFHADIPSTSKDFFMYELMKQKKFIGFEYRVIPEFPNATKEDVLQFTADFIDAAHDSSGGVL